MNYGRRVQINSASGEVTAPRGSFYMIVPTTLGGSTFKAKALLQNFNVGEPIQPPDFCQIGSTYEAGTGRTTDKVILGEFSKVICTAGECEAYYNAG
jgi:hypothetical protein